MTTITIAKSGATLREYAKTREGNSRVAIFPEAGMDANEQAAFLLNHESEYDEVITHSPFIISDADPGSINVLDGELSLE